MSKKRKFTVSIEMTSNKICAARKLHDWMLANPDLAPKNLHKVIGLLATKGEEVRNRGLVSVNPHAWFNAYVGAR